MVEVIWLVAGLALILAGANLLTDGASDIARRMGVSDLVVGLTVVAFGTSTPELVISVVSAASGNPSIAVGNVVGSNILNILLIIGVTALIRPIVVERSVMTREIPMVVLSSAILLVFGYSSLLDGGTDDVITRVDGIMLLVFFALFLRYTLASAKGEPTADLTGQSETGRNMPVWRSLIYIVLGLAGLIWGGDRFVDSASAIARTLGVSEAVIGLTIVAVGTSLPELATSVVAAVKGKPGLAIGNVIGSNIFNILLILGAAATVCPLPFEGITHVDLWTMTGASVAFFLVARVYGHQVINRVEGAALLLSYVAYMLWLLK